MGATKLSCRECGADYALEARYVCDRCFGPLEVAYEHDIQDVEHARRRIQGGPQNIWRYHDFLPLEGPQPRTRTGLPAGCTPLVRADRLAARLGIREVWVKNDAANPTHSFKDRVVSVASTRARELGYDTPTCASTGNLANSVAAHGAALGMQTYVFIPADLEEQKVLATGVYGTKIAKGFEEWRALGLVRGDAPIMNGAQAEGCSPVASAYAEGKDFCKPVKPDTIAKSLAIGNPADGPYALDLARRSGGAIDAVTDDEIRAGIRLLTETTGIFTETAGGVTTAVLAKLAERGAIDRDERVVLYITGDGLKTIETVRGTFEVADIAPSVEEFEAALGEAV